MSTKRIFASLCLLAFAACNDDEMGECVGHLCGSDVKISDPDGGNILFEYIYFDTELAAAFQLPAGVTTANRVMAYFMNSHMPDNTPLPASDVCTDLVTTKGWPMYVSPTHEDLDVGAVTITGKNTAGADVTIAVPKKPMGTDNIGRPHNTFYEIVSPDGAKFLKHNSSYTVNFGGAGTIPATSFPDGLFLSEAFTVSSPGLEDNGPMVAGTDFPVQWTPATSSNLPAGSDVQGVTWLVDAAGSPTHICPTTNAAGKFTIPGKAITEYKAIAQARGLPTTKVILLRNAIVHHLRRLPNGDDANKRRIDMLTVNCWAQLMDVQ